MNALDDLLAASPFAEHLIGRWNLSGASGTTFPALASLGDGRVLDGNSGGPYGTLPCGSPTYRLHDRSGIFPCPANTAPRTIFFVLQGIAPVGQGFIHTGGGASNVFSGAAYIYQHTTAAFAAPDPAVPVPTDDPLALATTFDPSSNAHGLYLGGALACATTATPVAGEGIFTLCGYPIDGVTHDPVDIVVGEPLVFDCVLSADDIAALGVAALSAA